MLDRQGSRFALEVLFLAALATGLALAKLDTLEIVGVMALGWLVVALLEWAAWRNEPHYGSGLPPRYYVPSTSLPPPQPLEQVYSGYPDPQREEAPTWIASADLRSQLLGEWPVTAAPDGEEDDDIVPVVLPPAPPPPAVLPHPPAPVQVAPPPPAPPVPLPVLPVAAAGAGVATHQLEPFGAQPARRRFGRRAADETFAVEVPARVVPPAPPRTPSE
ncbi:MAG TPA: hypothetical protein VH538_06250 [Gaiellaceae bacterium]